MRIQSLILSCYVEGLPRVGHVSLINVRVPIRKDDMERALIIAQNTTRYLIDQAAENIKYTFETQREKLVHFLDFLANYDRGRIHFAARGRSLYLGARTLADRLIQLGINAVYPTLEQYVVYDPNAYLSKGDMIICFSTSGKTMKVVKKAKFGREIGCEVVVITGNLDSPLASLATKSPIFLHPKHNSARLLQDYEEEFKPITPLGTTSEFTQLIFSEAISRGLKEIIEGSQDTEKAYEVSLETALELLNRAKRNTKVAYSHREEVKEFLANLILKYYSQQTVHFCARGKTFNMAVGPFKMRLDQIPHAFVTSILDFEPLNRPVRKGQLTIAVSGSGGAYTIAKMAKEMGSMVIGITSSKNQLWEISDVKILVPGRKDSENTTDWDIRQWKGWRADFAPDGTEFEVSAAAFLEGIFGGLVAYIGIEEKDMREGHANIE